MSQHIAGHYGADMRDHVISFRGEHDIGWRERERERGEMKARLSTWRHFLHWGVERRMSGGEKGSLVVILYELKVHPKVKFQSWFTQPHADRAEVKISPQNISGASRQYAVVAFCCNNWSRWGQKKKKKKQLKKWRNTAPYSSSGIITEIVKFIRKEVFYNLNAQLVQPRQTGCMVVLWA